jgi:hypothetical protein
MIRVFLEVFHYLATKIPGQLFDVGLDIVRAIRHEDVPALEKNAAFDKLVATIASSGLQVVSSNKDLGIISASQTVSYGEGKTVPLNVVVKDIKPRGVRVEVVFSLSGGLVTSADTVQEKFCNLLASVSS